MTSIYVIVDPRNGRVRYVGQTRNPAARAYQHGKPYVLWNNPAHRAWLAELSRYEMRPRFIEIGRVRDARALGCEREAIRFHVESGARLFNVADVFRPSKPYPHHTDGEILAALDGADGDRTAAAMKLGCSPEFLIVSLRRIKVGLARGAKCSDALLRKRIAGST